MLPIRPLLMRITMEVDSDSDDGIVLINHRNYTKME